LSEENISYCGLYCGTCGIGSCLVGERAKKLQEIIEAYNFEDWVPDFFEQADAQIVLDQAIKAMGYSDEDVQALRKETEQSKFDYAQFKAGLEWFTKVSCPGCREGGGMPMCPVKVCAQSKSVGGCWACEEMEECRVLVKLAERSEYTVIENLKEIQKMGETAYAKKMEKKAAAGFDNVLDRKPFGESEKSAEEEKKD
jgi:hypothetical protein